MGDEIWKDIPGKYLGYYQVSNLGRIRSLDREVKVTRKNHSVVETHIQHFKGKVLSQNIAAAGYLGVTISIDNHTYYPSVHSLVALAFVPNPENKPQVDHIDGNRLNNHADNLRWVTSKENHSNAISKGQHTCQKDNPYKRKQIRDVDTGEIFESMQAAEDYYNIPRGRISYSIKSDQRVYGHKFELVETKNKKLFNF